LSARGAAAVGADDGDGDGTSCDDGGRGGASTVATAATVWFFLGGWGEALRALRVWRLACASGVGGGGARDEHTHARTRIRAH
jgi:hypothetical protein